MSGFVGLGLAAKIAIGAGAAAAVGITGVGAAGATGVLPTDAQVVFEQVTGVHPGGEHVSDAGIENSEFGITTSEEAQLKAEVKREAALENATDKVKAGLESATDKAQAGLETATEKAQAGLETAEEVGQTGLEAVEGAGDIADEVGGAVDLDGDAGVDAGAGVQGH
ncbi:hypothetical protein J7E25_01115 [Agromyces sp. ISL-38]|uniref:hypothetical protein n=1 Tax=Agromyces sp. ISL-38 TaxID=2819107 RepID=UPI001BE5648D|nr:hypothetical protein [Agromyces sp. ISL-38]MBT2497688.1 hypothetical protein [Agromyces sp. ISL-38]